MARKIEVSIVGDASSLERAFGRAETRSEKFGRAMGTASKFAAGGIAALAVGAFKGIQAASSLTEAQNKVNVVFDESAGRITRWSETTADALGISQRAALTAAGGFGDFFQKAGQAEGAAAKFSQQMIVAAADLGSFNDADPSEVLEALRSGLAGEVEPLRRFGIFMSEATLQTYAYEKGIAKSGETLTEGQKILARQGFILENIGKASGDFARTSDDAANAERRANAAREDTVATLGGALLPAYEKTVAAAIDLVGWTERHSGATRILAAAIGTIAGAVILANASLSIYNSRLLTATKATHGLRVAMALTPWGLAALAVGGLVYWLTRQKDESDKGAAAMQRLVDAVKGYNDALEAGKAARSDKEAADLRLAASELAVQRAIQNRNQVEKNAKATLLERREADLAVAQAMHERRRAEDDVREAQGAFAKANGATARSIARIEQRTREATETFEGRYRRAAQEAAVKSRNLTGEQRRLNIQMAKHGVVSDYASRLQTLANKARESSPKLARTAQVAAALATAWGRVVSLPAAKEFVAKFSVITTIESHRLERRQHGGPVTADRSYIVGEGGPELFVPKRSGTIIPNGGNGGGRSLAAGAGGRVEVIVVGGNQAGIDWIRQLNQNYRRTNGGQGLLDG